MQRERWSILSYEGGMKINIKKGGRAGQEIQNKKRHDRNKLKEKKLNERLRICTLHTYIKTYARAMVVNF